MAALSTSEFGKLYVNNIVSTYTARAVGINPEYEHLTDRTNVEAVALAIQSKYEGVVFPASVSKSRIRLRDVPDYEPPAASVYPIRGKKRKLKSDDPASQQMDQLNAYMRKKAISRENKKIKEALRHAAKQAGPRQYITATDISFHSNQNVVAGGKTILSNMLTATLYLRRLSQELGVMYRVCNMKTQNIVCSMDLGFELNIEWMYQHAERQGLKRNFTPEEFTGLCIVFGAVTYVIFKTGKIVATGLKHIDQVAKTETIMLHLFSPFRKGNMQADGVDDFDQSRVCMRDEQTLAQIQSRQQTVATAAVKHSKVNATRKQQKSISMKLKKLMKTLAVREGMDESAISTSVNLLECV